MPHPVGGVGGVTCACHALINNTQSTEPEVIRAHTINLYLQAMLPEHAFTITYE